MRKREEPTSYDSLTKFYVVEKEREELRLHYWFLSGHSFTRKAIR